MSLWNLFGKAQKESEEENDNASPVGGTVDMTTLDITYITHRLLGEWCKNVCLLVVHTGI